MSRPRCLALTKAGDQCRGRAAEGSDYCAAHGPKIGRPTKLTERVVAALEQQIRGGAFNTQAAQSVGVDPRTLYRWLEAGAADEEAGNAETIFARLRQRLTRASADAELTMITTVRTAAATDWRAAAWYLERRNPDRWGRHDRVSVDGDLGKPKVVTPDEDRRAAILGVLGRALDPPDHESEEE
jgi:hypothetical protein